MSDIVCCPLSGGDHDGPEFCCITNPKARKPHTCEECNETIPVGAKYERYAGRWNGTMDSHTTCLLCVEIRDHFNCNGFLFGRLWEDLEENFFPDMKAGGPCMEGLSPEAKRRLFDKRMAWYEERNS